MALTLVSQAHPLTECISHPLHPPITTHQVGNPDLPPLTIELIKQFLSWNGFV